MNLDDVKRQITSLLNLAKDSGAAENEAENALRFARRLMLKNNLDESQLTKAKDIHESAADAESVTYGKTEAQSAGMSLTKWESYLAHSICKLVGTVQWYRVNNVDRRTDHGTLDFNDITGRPKRACRMIFYGPAEDCRDATELLEMWTATIMALSRMRFGGVMRKDGREYCEGFTSALYHRMLEIERNERVALPSGCTSLMVVNAQQLMAAKRAKGTQYLQRALGVKLKNTGNSRGNVHYNGSARSLGAQDGNKANFSHSKTKKLGNG